MSATAPVTPATQRYTVREAAEVLGVGTRTVTKIARTHGIGTNWGGRRGWDFTADELEAIRDTRRPQPAATKSRDPRGRGQRGVHA